MKVDGPRGEDLAAGHILVLRKDNKPHNEFAWIELISLRIATEEIVISEFQILRRERI